MQEQIHHSGTYSEPEECMNQVNNTDYYEGMYEVNDCMHSRQ